jgi:6-methylsalicylic acid synthase
VLRTLPLEAGQHRGSLFSLLGAEQETKADAPPGMSLSGLDPKELRESVQALVGSEIAAEMHMQPTALDARRSLVEQGLDSVMTIVVRRRLEKRFGLKVPATLLWYQPTVVGITEHLMDRLVAEEPDAKGEPGGALVTYA